MAAAISFTPYTLAMKKNFVGPIGHVLLLASYFFSTAIIAQKNTWTWIGGDAYHANSPVYEKVNGGPEAGPGAREGAAYAIAKGKLYLYGGRSAAIGMDPWYFSNSILINDESRGYRNDLWEFDLVTGKWRMLSGSVATIYDAYYPSTFRTNATMWAVDSQLYIYGGKTFQSHGAEYTAEFNRFDLKSGVLTNLNHNQPLWGSAVYGTKGVFGANNSPGFRQLAAGWSDGSRLYLFGGDRHINETSNPLNDLWEYDIKAGMWRWISGSNSAGQMGIYGSKGAFSPSNIPGARMGASICGKDGKIWLFGGEGYGNSSGGLLNDLWELDTSSMQWRWLAGKGETNSPGIYGSRGIPSPDNNPGARSGFNYGFSAGKLWVANGRGIAETASVGKLNDLWTFSFSTSEWTWINGSKTINTPGQFTSTMIPGARAGAAWWMGSNYFYLYGGIGIDSLSSEGLLNDLWRYDPALNLFSKMQGNASADLGFYKAGVYGTKGVHSADNHPGARSKEIGWSVGGRFYLFGGWGVDSRGKTGWLNDLWEYDPPSKKWAWISGFDTCNGSAAYGARGIPATENLPGPRGLAASWSHTGSLYLFGGKGLDKNGSEGMLNDLWAYDLLAKKWKWFKGADTINAPGSYGTLGNAAESNEPPPRGNAARWILNNKFYLFGGAVWNVDGFLGKTFNDTWEYNISSNQWRWLKGESAPPSADPTNDSTPGARASSYFWTIDNKLLLAGAKSTETWSYDPLLNRWHLLDKGSGWCKDMLPQIWFDDGTNWTVANGTYLLGGEGTSWFRKSTGDCCELFTWKGFSQQLGGGASSGDFLNATPLGGGGMDSKTTLSNNGINTSGGWPGARRDAVGWSLPGQLYLFGGYGMDASRMYGTLNDLWVYNLTDSVKPSDTAGSRFINDIHAEPHIATNPYNIVATIMPSGAQPVAGGVNIRLWIDAAEQRANGKAYSRRHFELQPAENAANATATVTLYFTQAEFDSFNTAGVSRKLPTNPNDAQGKSNLRISKTAGFSTDGTGAFGSYSGTEKVIDPDDNRIVWNSTHSRWEVAFETVGFSGFFLHTYETGLPVNYTYLQGTTTQQKNTHNYVYQITFFRPRI